jgi:2-polyprenyl-6-methoxyphenol hydroxylase-like FAD-dependent oxidoreductase
MAPNLGQGANSALVDAVVLAEELTSAPSVKDALARGTSAGVDSPGACRRRRRCCNVSVASSEA